MMLAIQPFLKAQTHPLINPFMHKAAVEIECKLNKMQAFFIKKVETKSDDLCENKSKAFISMQQNKFK
jgi:hypothetical protein